MIKDEVLLIFLTVIAAVICVPLAVLTGGLLSQLGLPTPGIYVWGLLHPHPEPGFLVGLGSLLRTEIVVDSICCFIVLMAVAFLVDRAVKRRKRSA